MSLSCAPRGYSPPTEGEPHAVVELRVTHHSRAGDRGGSRLRVDGSRMGRRQPAPVGYPTIIAYRVHPGLSTFIAETRFYHLEEEQRLVPNTNPDALQCQGRTEPDGTVTILPGTCHRSNSRYQSRTVSTRVTDAECRSATRFAPQAGRTYVLQYDFYRADQCELRCFERTSADRVSGQVFSPCPAPEPAPSP